MEHQFFINYKIVEICDRLNILRTTGDGATASWFVNYCLGITLQNPVKEGYRFEQYYIPEKVDFVNFSILVPSGFRNLIYQELENEIGQDYDFLCPAVNLYNSNLQRDIFSKNEPIIEYDNIKYYVFYTQIKIIPKYLQIDLPIETINGTKYIFFDNIDYNFRKIEKYHFSIGESSFLKCLQPVMEKLPQSLHPFNLDLTDKDVFEYIWRGNFKHLFPERLKADEYIKIYKPENIEELMSFFHENFFYSPNSFLSYFNREDSYYNRCPKYNYVDSFEKDKRVGKILQITYGRLLSFDQVFEITIQLAGMSVEEASCLMFKTQYKYFDIDKERKKFYRQLSVGMKKNSFLEKKQIRALMNKIKALYEDVVILPLSELRDNAIVSYWAAYYCFYYPELVSEALKSYDDRLEAARIERQKMIDAVYNDNPRIGLSLN